MDIVMRTGASLAKQALAKSDSGFWKRFVKPGGWMRHLLCCLIPGGLLLCVGCYDPDPIEAIAVSPDGRHLAVINEKGDLGLKRTGQEGPLTIYSNYNEGRVAWSPDSSRLAFVEHFPRKSPAIWIIDAEQGRQAQPLLEDPSWKDDPVWLSDHELAFRSDRQAEDINVWILNLETHELEPIIDRSADVSRLWGSTLGENLIFQTAETGASELWWWWPEAANPVQLTRDQSRQASLEHAVTFSIDGRYLAYVSQGKKMRELVWFDLLRQLVSDRTPLDRPAQGLAVLEGGEVAVSQGDHLLLWQPDAPWYRRSSRRIELYGAPLTKPGVIKGMGLALSVNQNILLLTGQPDHPETGELLARSNDDMLKFCWTIHEQGMTLQARELLDDLWASTGEETEKGMPVAAGMAVFERMQGNRRQADQWLARVTGSEQAEPMLRESAWLERLALALCESDEPEAVAAIMDTLPEELADEPLPQFVRDLSESGDEELDRLWRRAGAALRTTDYEKAGGLALDAMKSDGGTTISLEGLTLMLMGELDPFRTVDGRDEERQRQLMEVPGFQMAMLEASRRQALLAEEMDGFVINFRQLLLIEWARQGDLNSARQLVSEDLADPARTLIDYVGMIESYLIMEELDRWLEQAVSDVVLSEDHKAALEPLFAGSKDLRMVYCLAQAKAALVAGETDQAAQWLEQCKALEEGPRESDADESGINHPMRGYLDALAWIYRAKVMERKRNFPEALRMYREVLTRMDETPVNWEVAASDVAWTIGLLERGMADQDLLGSYLIALRGLGDPLVNPAHEPASVSAVMSSMEELRRVTGEKDKWLRPYLLFTQGLCFSKLNRPDQALYFISSARRMQPEASQLQRILYEEAAIRSTQGQHALAVRLYGELAALPTPMPVRADALLGQIQSEWDCGLIESPGRRVFELLADQELTMPWHFWLFDQLGIEIVHLE